MWPLTAIILLLLLVLLTAVVGLNAYGRRPLPEGHWDAIIVAGALVKAGGRPSQALDRRVRLGVALLGQGRAPLLVFTGGTGRHPPSEAEASLRLARTLGVCEEQVVLEARSATTEQNALFAARLIEAPRVLVVTDAYHVLRCERVFGRAFGEVRGVGAPVPVWPAVRYGLREVVALVRYGVAGRL